MSFEFVIPLTRDDLLQKSSVKQYVVDEVFSIRNLIAKIKESESKLKTEGPLLMLSSFDVFFSVLVQVLQHFNNLEPDLKETSWRLILKVISSHTNLLVKFLEGDLPSDAQLQNLNALKMNCYLLCQFSERFEQAITGATTITVAGKGKKKSSKTSVAASESESIDWEAEREVGIKAMLQLLQLNVHRLWDPPVVEEEFVNLVTSICYKLLENVNVTKNKSLRDSIFQIIGIMVKRYNHTIGCTLKMLQLLQQFEHLATPFAQAVELFVNNLGVKGIVSEIMREIGRMDPKELSRDTSGTRAFANFLVELGKCVPAVMLPSISVLLVLLDEESYQMRNSVLGVLGEMIVRVLSREDLDSKQKSTRDQFLDKLEDHIHDVNAYVRSRVLQIWLYIVNEKALPLPRQQSLLLLVIGRLQDKSSQVRKNTIEVLIAIMRMNPLAAQLTLEELKANYEKERDKLKEMMPETTVANVPAAGEVENKKSEWKKFEKNLKKAVEKLLDKGDESDEDEEDKKDSMEEEENFNSAKLRFIDLLSKKRFSAGFKLYKSMKETWPNESPFSDSGKDSESDNSGQESIDEDSDESDSNSTELRTALRGMKSLFLGEKVQNLPAPSENSVAIEGTVVNDLTKQQVLVQYLKDSLSFVTEVHKSIPVVCQLLGSKMSTDVSEAIDFFVSGFELGVSSCLIGIRKMLSLVWSKEQDIKNSVVEAYKRIYLNPKGSNPRTQAVTIATSLISLTIGITLGDLTSLEELIQEFVRSEDLEQRVIQVLWEKFAMKLPGTTAAESRGALVLLGMAAGAQVETVQSNIGTLIKEGLGPRAEDDFLFARDTCSAFIKLSGKSKSVEKPFRFDQDNELFQRLSHLLITGMARVDKSNYIPMAEQAISLIYKLAEHPDQICGDILKQQAAAILAMSAKTEKVTESGDDGECVEVIASAILTRFLFVCGHVAFHQLIHLDVAVFGELKRRLGLQEQERLKGKGRPSTVQSTGGRASASASTAKARKESRNEATIEEEMGLAGAAAEDSEAEYIRKITETDLVTGGANLLAVLQPLIVHVCNDQAKYNDPDLRSSAALALAKFMIVSSEFCEDHLQLLFTILEKSSNPTVRANTIIALGDLTFRFPNMIEPWTANIYNRLRDDSIQVRKNTLLVLTHLILNDMIKVKGQISELATCVLDDDPQISCFAKLFFFELSKKANTIYNILPDVISRLSDLEVGVTEDQFRPILKYLMSFIQKERQCESLVEKLCHRFRATMVERQWRDLAFCLSLLSFNDKSVRKLQENFACFADKLSEEFVYECFMNIVNNAKKLAKPEAKALVDELEQRINQSHTKGVDEEEVSKKASKAAATAKTTKARSGKSAVGRSAKKKYKSQRVSEEEEEEESDEEGAAETAPSRKSPRQAKTKTKPILKLSSDDDSDFDMPVEPEQSKSTRRAKVEDEEDVEHPPVMTKKTKSVSNRAAATRSKRK